MKFIDEVEIHIKAGDGGNGAVSFRREKYVEFGGRDGGNGADGGNVIFEASTGVNTLVNFRGRKVYNAPNGENGSGSRCDGKTGEDLVIKVPVGTLIYDTESGELLADMNETGQQEIIAVGGRGGLGNAFFKSSTNQAPRYAKAESQAKSFT